VIGVAKKINEEIKEIWTETKNKRILCLIKQLELYFGNYGALEVREAQSVNPPVGVMNEKDMTEKQINRILREIRGEDGLIKDAEDVITSIDREE
jgi:hypothetical protein